MPDMWIRTFPPEKRDVRPLNANTEPYNMPPESAKPAVYFLLTFTVNLMKRFVVERNR
jgi:hypothetical protein